MICFSDGDGCWIRMGRFHAGYGRNARMRIRTLFPVLAAWMLLIFPSEALAIQTHGGTEGLYAHQFGHVLFFVAMILLYFRLRGQAEFMSRGWRYVTISCLLFAGWNVVAFTGHCLEEMLTVPVFAGGSTCWERALSEATGWKGLVLYVCKFDHLLAVPAMLFFLLGLRAFARERQ